MGDVRLHEVSRDFVKMMARIMGPGSAEAKALIEANKYTEGARFLRSHGSIIVIPKDRGLV